MAKYGLGLALSGGSIKGFAHLGVLKRMGELGLQPEIIAGTSAGALMGALYADGYQPEEILELFDDRGFTTMASLKPLGGGMFDTSKFESFLRKHLRHQCIEDLPIPLRIVATNLDRGEQQVFDEGPLAKCITASCSIPVLFNPTEIEGTSYIDGGIFRNFPASVLRPHCQLVLGVHLNPAQPSEYKKTIMSVAERSWQLIFRQNAQYDRKHCDILIEPQEAMDFGMFDLTSSREIMQLGYDLASQVLASADTQSKLAALS